MITLAYLNLSIGRTEETIKGFIRNQNPNDKVLSDYEDWCRLFVVGHIAGWLSYSADKLSSIISGNIFTDFDSIDQFNRDIFERTKTLRKSEIVTLVSNALSYYTTTISKFNQEDLVRKDLPTGFDFELWKYILMDGAIHPIQHILYQEIKEKSPGEFSETALRFFEDFWIFANSTMSAFELDEFISGNSIVYENIKAMIKDESSTSLSRVILKRNLHLTKFST